ncbi:MAG: hypothetical protein RLZ98_2214 [Pseudomonadota bacterium]|jgi:N-methylhydantoinase A
MSLRIGIDVGGTFTDVTAYDDARNEVTVRKYVSSPADPMAVMREIASDLAGAFDSAAVTLLLHGSTAALNTLIEDKGVRCGLITTAGFRDVYEIGRQWRGDDVFTLIAPAPKMLLTRDLIHEVRGRLDARGNEIAPLVLDDVRAAARALVAQGVQSIAVAFLFSYANPSHEQAARAAILDVAPGIYVSLSSTVNPEWREYERTASTVANAYIGPPVSRYLHDLDRLCDEHFPNARALMMKSDGGAASAEMLSDTPVQTVMSGPVAGVIGGRFIGTAKGLENLITFDTGGTSSDMAVIAGDPVYKSDGVVGRHPVRTRTVDIETIGAGGGSIAHVELGGVLKVGPESAGAMPGPACYGRGGKLPTLTDALVVLGHINPGALLDGAMTISHEKALEAVREHIARPLGMSEVEAALGILRVLVTNCVVAMRTITVERGYDPREFVLVPFGGMGPTIAGQIAPELGIGRVLVPRDPGTFSAWGMLVTDVRHDRSVTRITRLDDASPQEIDAVFAELEAAALRDLERERIAKEHLSALRYAGMRYRGQSYEVDVPLGAIRDDRDLAALAERFHDAHRRRYGHMAANEAVEIVNYKVTGVGAIPKPQLKRHARGPSHKPEPAGERRVHFADDPVTARIYKRAALVPGAQIAGPAIIEEQTSTTVLYPGQSATVDEYGMMDLANLD